MWTRLYPLIRSVNEKHKKSPNRSRKLVELGLFICYSWIPHMEYSGKGPNHIPYGGYSIWYKSVKAGFFFPKMFQRVSVFYSTYYTSRNNYSCVNNDSCPVCFFPQASTSLLISPQNYCKYRLNPKEHSKSPQWVQIDSSNFAASSTSKQLNENLVHCHHHCFLIASFAILFLLDIVNKLLFVWVSCALFGNLTDQEQWWDTVAKPFHQFDCKTMSIIWNIDIISLFHIPEENWVEYCSLPSWGEHIHIPYHRYSIWGYSTWYIQLYKSMS